MKNIKYLALAALLTIAVGCELVKTEIGAPTVDVDFRADVEHAATKAAEAMGSQTQARVIAFAQNADVTSATPLSNQVMTSDASGNLSGEKITLDRGTYDFYGVSGNNQSTPVVFTNGMASVTNGVDYLWNKQVKALTAADKNVNFGFAHKAVMVKITITGANMTFANTVIKIRPSNDLGATMALATGVIVPASAVKGTYVAMSLVGTTASYAMIPLMAGQNIAVEITTTPTIDGVAGIEEVVYDATIPQQSAGFLAGKLYSYVATITADQEVTLSGATIGDWENGNGAGGEEINPTERPSI